MKVVFFHRKPAAGNFSIENLFQLVRSALPKDITCLVHEASKQSNGFLKRLWIGLEALRSQGDVNHVTGDIHFVTLFLKKKKTVLTIHDIGFLTHRNHIARFLLKLFWLDLPLKNCSIVTTVSKATREEILKNSSISAERIRVIYNPVSPLFTVSAKRFNKDEPVILQIGTKYNKNMVRLIQAIAGLKCKLHIVGEVEDMVLRQLKLHNVKFTLFKDVANEEMLNLYIGADIVSFASTLEGFGLPIVEANAVGRVVVTSNRSSMPEIAGNAAHFVDPFDVASIRQGIVKVTEDDKYRENLIANGFENRKRFDTLVIANQYAEIYRDLYNHSMA